MFGSVRRIDGLSHQFPSMASSLVAWMVPFQTWSLTRAGTGTKVVLVYSVGGYLKGGFAGMSAACDGMLTGTVARFERYLNTGNAAASK